MIDKTIDTKLSLWASWLPLGAVIFEVSEGKYYRTTVYWDVQRSDAPPDGIPVVTVDKTKL
jgi:hypothetical protein